ncbi:MAG: TonB-dependent receptor [Bryobacterales bacterium]|nr:TonB-dependent receptor [Bryobacterales bacterium]
MNRFLPYLFMLFSSVLWGQNLTSLNGTVTDSSGAVVPGAKVSIENQATGASRGVESDTAGKYTFPQLAPGTYKVTAAGQGFATATVSDVRLLVSTPATLNITLEVGAITQTVNVSGEGTQVNTQDASLGNALGTRPILQLPLEGRNVVGLLSLQPGVTFLGENSASSRSGSVNGGKSDQANVTLDGVDVNDQQNRSAFTSVLRVTLDSVQEFRVITTNANAEFGRSSGAQINLVTKSGTNALHGSMYEFHRNTLTTANSFLSNAATPRVERPKLIRNVFGASVGGPVVKNKAFYFLNYEGRRDASELGAQRTVPTAEFRQGIVQYQRTDNSIARLSAERIRQIDPLGIGPNAEVLKAFQSYPLPNNNSSGDGLNTAGYRFIAPVGVRWNTYLARFDFSPSASGRHNLFLRGNLQNDHSNTLPQFPNQPPNSVDLANSKGMAAGYNVVLRPNLIASLRYGFTRQGLENSGTQVASAVQFFTLSDPVGLTTAFTRLTPVHNPSQDFTWTRGAHNIQFGAVQRFVRNRRVNYERAFHSAQTRASRLEGSGAALDLWPDLNRNARDNYRSQMVDLLGIISTANANYNYDLQGNVQALGTPVDRTFGGEEYEFYGQDTWRATRSLTFTVGLRYSLMPPIYETNGVLVSLTPSLGDWFNQRGGLAQQGLPGTRTTPIRYVPKGHPDATELYAYHKKNFAPRFAVAWSPQSTDGVGKWLFGGPGRTSIRAGWGMFYELFGQSLINRADAGGLGLSTQIQTAGSQFNERTAPRFTGVFNLPAGLIPAAPRQQFPIEAPFSFARGSNIDSSIVPPYTMNLNFSVGREFGRGLFVQASYVGRLSRRSLIQSDVATPANLVDPKSGMDYFAAARQLAELQVANTAVANVPAIAYWENLWPGAAGRGLTATQAVYQRYVARAPDYATALEDIDFRCNPSCSVFGPYAIYDRQFASFTAWRSIVGGSYHAMQWTVQQRMKNVEFAFNYTLSKSLDQGSRAESDGTGATFGFLTNPWNPGLHKGVSDYDMRHQWNVYGVVELPVGKGQRWLNRGGVADAVLGGWQLSGIYRQSSGLPIGVRNGRAWPTNWQWQGFATQVAGVANTGSHKNAPSVVGNGGPNIFADPNVALNAFQFTRPGGSGTRYAVRGDGIFTIDSNLAKSFRMPYAESHRLQIRWEVFNVTNSVVFDVASLSLDIGSRGTFGRYSGLLTQPRVMQFGARYEF